MNPTLALASLVGFLTAASCTLITDVDRTKIPTDAGPEGGAPGTGGTGGTGGKGGGSGKGGSSGAGTGGSTGGSGGTGVVTPDCHHAEGSITVGPDPLYFDDGDTITIGDGINPPVVFELDLQNSGLEVSSHKPIDFDGTENNLELVALIHAAINNQGNNLRVGAVIVSASQSGSGGAAGAAGSAGNGQGGGGDGQGGASGGTAGAGGEGPIPPGALRIELSNDYAGALGNVRIKETAGNPNLKVAGMSGGNSVACDSESSCTDGDECASGECGDDKLCTPAQ
jgi:hypothetical protein